MNLIAIRRFLMQIQSYRRMQIMSVLDYAIRIIKATMKNHSNESFFPYFFIVGAGISVPEIPAAYEIIDECKDKSKKFDEISYIQFENEIKSCETFVFLKYVAYLNLCSISSEADAVNYIEKAEQLLPRLVKPELEMALYIQKAQNLNFVNDETIRRVWVNQILEILRI